nr:MAG TPA: hypothetical protein [Caudoviricetes sp.]
MNIFSLHWSWLKYMRGSGYPLPLIYFKWVHLFIIQE